MKLFRRGPTGEGYGNIYTPHAGSMIIQVQREHGLANRQIILTERQVKLLKSLATRKWLVVGAFMIATWAWLVVDRCISAPLCNAGARLCDAPLCQLGQQRCTGSVLERCNADQSDFAAVVDCLNPALCDPRVMACLTTPAPASASPTPQQ